MLHFYYTHEEGHAITQPRLMLVSESGARPTPETPVQESDEQQQRRHVAETLVKLSIVARDLWHGYHRPPDSQPHLGEEPFEHIHVNILTHTILAGQAAAMGRRYMDPYPMVFQRLVVAHRAHQKPRQSSPAARSAVRASSETTQLLARRGVEQRSGHERLSEEVTQVLRGTLGLLGIHPDDRASVMPTETRHLLVHERNTRVAADTAFRGVAEPFEREHSLLPVGFMSDHILVHYLDPDEWMQQAVVEQRSGLIESRLSWLGMNHQAAQWRLRSHESQRH